MSVLLCLFKISDNTEKLMKNTSDSAFILMSLTFIMGNQVAEKSPTVAIIWTAIGGAWCIIGIVRSFLNSRHNA